MTPGAKTPSGFYVYAYLRAADSKDGNWLAQTPYYVGKGKGGRAWQVHSPIPRPKNSSDVMVLAEGLSETDAHALEKLVIRHLGRADIKTGCLRNFTDGGEGQSGRKMSQETREKLRQHFLGKKNPRPPGFCGKPGANLGVKLSPERRLQCAANRGKKLIMRASSPYFGVHWLKNKSRWRAYVRVGGKNKPLGTSRDPIVCARLYDRYVRENNLDKPVNFPELPLIFIDPKEKPNERERLTPRFPGTRPYSRKKRNASSSPYYGVHWTCQRKNWRACVYIEGQNRYLGSSSDPIVVAKAYDHFVISNNLDWPLNFPSSSPEPDFADPVQNCSLVNLALP